MTHSPELAKHDYSIPGALNVFIAIVSLFNAAGLLWIASHADNWMVIATAAIGFSFVNNTIFSLPSLQVFNQE